MPISDLAKKKKKKILDSLNLYSCCCLVNLLIASLLLNFVNMGDKAYYGHSIKIII